MFAGSPAELTAWLCLDRAPGLGPVRSAKLLARYPVTTLVALPDNQLKALGLDDAQIRALHYPDKAIEGVIEWLAHPSRHLIPCSSPNYPSCLREISSAPLLLFVEGDAALLHSDQIAMVGTREPSPGGREVAAQLSRDLVNAGLTVTSGLALGIDGICHQSALDAGGKTIAVLGSGLANCYPKRHQQLAEAIVASGGALVSEFWPEVAPRQENFPRRNRIISGLSLGTAVVEAAVKSGSLITARYAMEQGREVFAVPGALQNPQSVGCHHLIQQGAKLICSVADIVEEIEVHLGKSAADIKSQLLFTQGDLPSSSLLDNVGYEPTAIDVIASRSGVAIDKVICELLELELAGWISSVPGGYVRTRRN